MAVTKSRIEGNGQSVEKKAEKSGQGVCVISPPNMHVLHQRIEGTAPYVQSRFPEKARQLMQAKHEAGSTAKKGGKKEARNFDEDYRQSTYHGPKNEYGIPASCFRAAAVSACRLVNFKMTLAKLCIFTQADFFDLRCGTPLVAIEGTPRSTGPMPVRNATGVADLRVRARWDKWAVNLRIEYDADIFRTEDVINLLGRIGAQVGIGEGRADSKESIGMGWGSFKLVGRAKDEVIQVVGD